jgi:hypothetical protein
MEKTRVVAMRWNKTGGTRQKDRRKLTSCWRCIYTLAANAHDHVVKLLDVLEDGMEHHAQVLLALSICSALSLGTWIWARRQLTRLQASIDSRDTI